MNIGSEQYKRLWDALPGTVIFDGRRYVVKAKMDDWHHLFEWHCFDLFTGELVKLEELDEGAHPVTHHEIMW